MFDTTRARAHRCVAAILTVALVTLASLVTSPTASAADVTEAEFNGSVSTADSLPLGDTMHGTGYSASNQYDVDTFRVFVPQGGRLTLDVRFPAGTTGDALMVSVSDAYSRNLYTFTLSGAQHDGSWLRSQATFVSAGYYFVAVTSNEFWTTWNRAYTLTPTLTPANQEAEPNGTLPGRSLALGERVAGSSLAALTDEDFDWYSLTLTSRTRISPRLTFQSSLGTGAGYQVGILDSTGAPVRAVSVKANQNSGTGIPAVDLGAGTWYLRLEGRAAWATWGKPYTLRVLGLLTKTPTPSISGTARIGKTLKAKAGTWGPGTVTLKYQWLRGGKAITGATKSTYKLTSKDKGAKVSVKVTGSRSGYATVSKTSKSVTALYSFSKTPKPTISGTAKVGKKLTAKAGTWSPKATLTYRWLRDGKAISGATKKTYTLTTKDKGKKISVKVTGKKKYYATVAKTSATKKIS
ncbi:hypothetical protein [Tessaracoccus palaemonis]|uniref:Peptidase C-terminal archaeal/bacterial domain-containing protein n=1 Tax=Tessaracoccus palaemonis TaxID=2829499 RepID=A0ABX8SL02_9ACTN|nr:hypothetical protein [Tessaracoccus palaemonis]QXT63965.1 hypothetical protein KDB89_05795 [Tessaracoccus palaemonis]